MRPYSKLVDLARQHGWTFDGRTHHEYQIKILMRDRRVRLTALPAIRGGHVLEVRVELPSPGLPQFRISRMASFELYDLEIGVPGHLRSPEPDELRRVWTAERCELARQRLVGMVAHASHEQLVVELHRADRDGRHLDDAAIVDALQLALDLAHADVYGLAALRALPEAVVRQTDGPHVELAGPAPIVIRPVRDEDRVFTRAAMQCAQPELPPTTPALGSARLAREGNLVTISWPTIEEDPHRLLAAVELLRCLTSAPHDGAYR
jgi:hypothetical protein